MPAITRTPPATKRVEPRACTLSRRLDALRQTPFFADLPARAISDIGGFFREKGFTADESIYISGDPALGLYVVADGKVKLVRVTESGKTVVLGIIGTGEFFGSLSTLGDRVYPDSAMAQTDCCVLTITGADFQAILRGYPEVANAALQIVAARLAAMQELVEQLGAHPAEQRVASILLALAGKLGEKKGNTILIQMPLTRQDLAEMTGIRPETASRIMTRFRRSGLIRTGQRWVEILDPVRMAAEAGVRRRNNSH